MIGGAQTDAGVVLELATGQRARIGPAGGDHLRLLQAWDDWMSGLPAADELALDELRTAPTVYLAPGFWSRPRDAHVRSCFEGVSCIDGPRDRPPSTVRMLPVM